MSYKYINIVKKPLMLYSFFSNISDELYNKIFSYIDNNELIYIINIIKYKAREILININPQMYISNITINKLSKDEIYYIIINYSGFPIEYNSNYNFINISNIVNIKECDNKCSNYYYNINRRKILSNNSINIVLKLSNLNKLRKKDRLVKQNNILDEFNYENY